MDSQRAAQLLTWARESILSEWDAGKNIDVDAALSQYPELKEKQACFVTLTQKGQLRGCIGSLIPHRALIDDLIHNAKAAAFQDPRFQKVSLEEMETIEIELSLLSIPALLEYTDIKDLKAKIRPGIDGVILKSGMQQSTFLPQVWEQLPDFDSFFTHLCSKAGLSGSCLDSHPEIYTYQAEKFKENT